MPHLSTIAGLENCFNSQLNAKKKLRIYILIHVHVYFYNHSIFVHFADLICSFNALAPLKKKDGSVTDPEGVQEVA